MDFWKNKVPEDHPKLRHAVQELEDLKRKSFLELPLSSQANRLRQSIKDDTQIKNVLPQTAFPSKPRDQAKTRRAPHKRKRMRTTTADMTCE